MMKTVFFLNILLLSLGCARPKNGLAPVMYENELEEAERMIKNNRSSETIDDISMLIQMAPKDPKAYFLRGMAYQKTGRFELAEKDYKTTLNLEPKHLKARYNLGMLYAYKLNERPLALKHFDQFLTDAPAHEEAFQVAKVMCSLDLPEQDLAQPLSLDPKLSIAEKRTALLSAMKQTPDSPLYYFLLGQTYEQENPKKAIELYERALERRPTCSLCHLALGKLLLSSEKKAEGKMHLRKGELFSINASKGPKRLKRYN